MRSVLFCDMDGTIINEVGLLSKKDKEWLEKYHDSGNIIVFNTGRNIVEALDVINAYKLTYDYLILNNGSHIVDKDGNELFKQIIDGKIGEKIICHCLNYPDLWIYYYDGTTNLAYYQGATYLRRDGMNIKTSQYDFKQCYHQVKEFDIIALNQADQQTNNILEIQQFIATNYGSYAQGTLNTHYLDITARDCSKGSGIVYLKNILGDEVTSYAIGDSYNDLSMFETADFGYTFNRVDDNIKYYSHGQVDYLYELIKMILKGEDDSELAR